jgi:hypothetical protein
MQMSNKVHVLLLALLLHRCLLNKLTIFALCNAHYHLMCLQTIQLINVCQNVQEVITQIIKPDNVKIIVVIGTQMGIKYQRHVQTFVNQELILIKQLLNVSVNALQIIGLFNLIEVVFSFAHMDISLIIQHQNVFKNVLQHILMQIL